MIGLLLRRTLSRSEVSFRVLKPGQDQANRQVISSLMRSYPLPPTYRANKPGQQPESSSEKEGVMNELPNLTILPICPREKLLMLSKLGKSQLNVPCKKG
jgi:hypothetical protein